MDAIGAGRLGVMFWPWFEPLETVRTLNQIGAARGQLGMHGEADIGIGSALRWRAAVESEAFPIDTVFAAYEGESYADIATVERTVGFVPVSTRAERLARTLAMIPFARTVGASAMACHVGCLPHDPSHATYVEVRGLVREICDCAAAEGLCFSLETGQESAAALRDFVESVHRANLRINFDPANMILYGTGDPIAALETLSHWLASVHAKDGDWPSGAGDLGVERRLGEGSVNIPRWVAKLAELGYQGNFYVEREVEPVAARLADMKHGLRLLSGIVL